MSYKIHFAKPGDPDHTLCGLDVVQANKHGVNVLPLVRKHPFFCDCSNCITLNYQQSEARKIKLKD